MANNLEILYNSLKRDNYDVPATYESFARTLTASGMEGVRNRQALYNSLRNDDYDVPDTYESFATTLFVPAMSRQNGNGISGAQAQRTGSGGKSTSRGDLVQTASTSQRDAPPTVTTSREEADPTVATSPRDAVQTASTSQRDAAPVGNVAPAGHVMTPSERLRVATHELEAAQSAVARKEEERKARQAEKDYYKAVQEEEEQIRERNAEGRARADAEGIDWNAVPDEGETEVRYDDLLSEQAQVKRLANTAGYLGPHLDKEGARAVSSDIGEGVYYHRDGRTSQEREPFAARARAMNDPEDIYRTPTGSGIDPRGASADPIALPELEVTGSSRSSIMKRVDEMRFLDESLKDVGDVELRKRASMELQSERDEVDARLEKWKEENPGKWRDMSREDRAELKAGFADDVNFERFMSGIDARIAANEREQQRRMSEIERQVREDLSKTPEGRRLLKEPDSDMDIRRRVELAAGYDSEIRALRQESWNLGEMRNAKLAAESDGGRESLWNFAKGVGRGLRDIVENPLGLKSMHNDATQLMRVFGKLQEGEALTDTEQRAVESHFTRQMDDTHYDMSQSAKAGEFTAALAEIAIEFGLNPASGAVRRVLTGIAREVGPAAVRATVMNAPALLYKLGVSSTEIGARAFAGNIAKVIGAAIGEGAGATFSTQLAKNLEESVSRAISMPVYDAKGNLAGLAGDSFGSAAAKTFTTSAGTNAVFMLPAHFGGEAMKGLGRFAEYVDQRGMGIPFGNPVDALVKMKSGEIIGVIASDIYGRSLGDPTMGDVFSEESAKEMIIGLLAAEFTTGGMKFAGRQIKGSTLDMAIIKNEAEVRRAAAKMAASLKNQDGAVDAEGLRILEMVMGADASMDPGVIGNCLKALAESSAPQETRQAALDYLRASYRWRGSVARREQWRESGKEQDWRDDPDVSTSRRDAAPTEESPSRRDAAPGKEAAPDGGRPRNERALVSPEEIEREKARQRADEALRGGYEAVDPEIRAEMQRNAESAVAGIYDRFEHPEDVMEILDGIEDAEGLIKEVHENEYMDALQKEAAEAYVLSSMAERGMSMRREDDRVKAREDIREDVGRMSTPDGMLRPVTLKRYDRQVMVLSGEIVLSDDGSTVLPSESSSVLWIYDPATGGPRAAAPEEILSVGPVMTAEAEIERRIKELEAIEAQAESQEVMSGSQSQATGSEVEADVDAVAMRMQQAYQAVEDAFGSEAEYYMFHVHENPEAVLSDPEIPDFQKDAVREYLEAMKALEEEDGKETTSKAETPSVPGMPENGPNSTENIVSEGEIAPEAVSNVENGQQTALSRIPTNEQGEPKFEAVDKDTAWDGLVEAVGGEADAADIAMAQVRQASTELEALKKKQPTLKAPKLQGSPMAMAQAKRKANEQYQRELSQYDQQIAEAQTRLDAWNGIVGVYKSRNAPRNHEQPVKRETNQRESVDDRSMEDFFGPVYTEFQGNGNKAEAYLREKCEGVAKGALTYPGIAPIDLAWGDMKAGYMKIVIKHPEVVGKLQELLDQCMITNRSDNRIVLESDTHKFVVSKMKGSTPTDNWLLTAYQKKEKPASASSSDIETEPGGKRNGTATPQNGLYGKDNALSADKQADSAESSGESPSRRDAAPNSTSGKEGARLVGETSGNLSKKEVVLSEENDENGRPFVLADDGTTSFGHIDEESGLTAAPIKLSEGFQDEVTGQGYGLIHIEAGHGEQIRTAGFKSVKDFVSFVAKNYDRDNIRVGKRRPNGSGTFLIQVTDRHDNTLFIELSKDGSYWNVNSGGIFRKGYSNKKETVAKTEPQQPDNAVSGGSSLSKGSQTGISPSEPNGKPTVSTDKVNTLSADKQTDSAESSGESPSRRDAIPNYESTPRREAAPDVLPSRKRSNTGVDKEIRAAAEEMRDCPEALEILSNMDPQDIYEAASVVLATNRVLLSDAQGAIGAKREMGLGRIEQKKYFGLFASAEKGGKSIQKLSEDAMQELCGQYGIPYDNMDARNALLEILQSHSTRGEIGNYIRNRRLEQARKIYRDWENMLEDEEERAAWEAYGMTLADLDAYNEMRDADAKEHLQDLDEREYNATFADIYAQREEEYDRRAKESVRSGDGRGIREIAGYESSGERPLSGRGDEVLSGEKSYKASGIEADERSGVQSGDGTEGAVETDGVSAGASGIANKITEAERLVNTEPTEAQKKAGNYRMGHVWVDGHNITIENPKGSVRRGVDVEGKPWETRMNNTYGYICGTQSVDGDHIDVFLSDAPERGDVFVVDQVDKDGNFDEHKVMYGFPSGQAARKAYLSNYKPGWTGLGAITHVSKDEFKKWIGSSKRKTKPFAEYKSVKIYKEQNPQLAIEPDGFSDFGPVFTQFKGNAQGAIKVLSELQDGEAIGALHHKDIGDIDLVWGNAGTAKSDGFGLAKLVKFHPEVVEYLQEILDDMHIVTRSDNRINLESDTHKAAVRLTWDKEKKKWLLTAFEKKETPKSIDKTTDTGDNPTDLRGDTALSQNSGVSDGKDNALSADKQADSAESSESRLMGLTEDSPSRRDAAPTEESASTSDGMMAQEPRRGYGRRRSVNTGINLFDWADKEDRKNNRTERDEEIAAAEEADSAIDTYADVYDEYLRESQRFENELANQEHDEESRKEIEERIGYQESRVIETRDWLEDNLKQFYVRNNTPEDAKRLAHDMVVRVQAEVEYRRNTGWMLKEILSNKEDVTPPPIEEMRESPVPDIVKTAGGERIETEGHGGLRRLGEGEFSLVERKFSTTGEFSFTTDGRIESMDDVAYIFRSLENYSVEHTFALLVKEGKPLIVHLGMGGPTASMADLTAIRAAYDAHGADSAWFVHNHPSGVMRPSPQDISLLKEVEKIFPAGVMQDGLIIDVTSGRYCTFDSSAGEVGKGEARHPEGAERPVEVKQFDRSAFKEGFDPEKLSQVTSSEAAARYISTERLGERAKTGVLLLNNQNKVVGNLYSRETDLKTYEARKRLVEEIAQLGTKYGARNVIIYGNSGIGALDKVMNLSEKISGISGGIRLLDVIQITNGLDSGTDVAYRSANDGTLRAAEPEVKSHREDSAMTGGEDRRYRDGHELSDGERLRAIRDLEPIEVERNDMSRAELREVYNNLPSVEKDGREIEFYRSAFKKIYKDGGLFGQVVPVLDEILEQSVLAYSEEDNLGGMTRPDGTIHKEHPNSLSFDNYVGKVDIDGIGHYVRITIQHDKGNRNGMHSCFVTEVEIYENAGLQATGTENSRVKPYNSGIVDANLQQFFERASAEADKLDMRDRAVELSEKLNTPIRIVTDEAELSELSEDGKPRYSRRERRAKGWWDGQTGEIVIVLPNNRDIADVDNTVVHEVVGHKGLRALVGEERFDEFLGEIYDHASNSIRKVIDKMTDDMVNAEADRLRVRKAQAHERTGEDVNANYYTDMAEARVEADAKRGDFRKEATEEYMADLGGRIGSEGFEKMSRDELTLWGKIKAKVQSFLDKFLRGLKIAKSIQLTDKDLAYILYKSWRNMRDGKSSLRSDHNTGGVFAEAEDVAMRMRTGWDDAMLSESAKMEDANNHFNRQLKRYMSGDMGKNEMLHLGMPLGVMSQFLPRLPIVMRQRVIRKGSEKKHEVDVESIMNMPQHLSSPIFVFQRSKDTIGVLTDMQDRNGKNVCVAIELKRQIQNGGECLEINDVRSFHGREFRNIVEPIVNNNTLKWVDKEKGLAYLSSASQPVQQEIDKQVLDYAAKVIKTFENPTFDSDEEVRFRDGADYVERVPVMARAMYEKQIQSSMYQFTEAMQDSMRGLMEFYKAVESQGAKRNIEDVASFENAYIAENLMSSKSHAEMEEYEHRILRPLLDVAARMSVNKRGRDKLIDYMMAKHGLERNAYMRNEAIANGEESERDFAGLCGLTGEQDWQDAETAALQIVDDYEAAHSADIAEFWGAVNKATKTSLKKIYDCGMLSKDQYEKIRDMYDYYIPLRGFDEKTSDDVYGYLTGKGGAFSSPIKRAEGRKSKADDPLATIAYMAQNSILQGNRNVMKQRFLTYVHNHPSDLASVNRLWLVHDETADTWKPVFADVDENMTPDEIDKAVMNFEQRMEALSQSEPDKYKCGRDAIGIPYRIVDGNIKEHQVLVKRNGESFVITINGNPRAAQAINGLTNPDNDLNGAIGKVFNVAGTVNRWLSQVYTTLNPDFSVANFIRDLIYSNTMVHVKENQSYAMKFHKNHAKVNPVRMVRLLRLYDENRLDMHNPVHRMFYEFMHWGGETGYTMQRNLEQEKKLVSKILKEARRGKLHPMSILNLVGNGLDQINRGVENSARFAAFITSRESGRNIQRSVYDAKEVSVNFNKKGAGSKFMDSKGQTIVGKTAGFTSGLGRSFYVFWNAAVQGTTNYAKAFKKHPGKAMMTTTALVLLGYVMAALLDDGDDESKNGYYNVPKYTRRSNLMFHSGNQWITIPLPVEYRALYGLGELAYGVTSGREEYSDLELAKETASQLSQILPLDFMEGDGGLHAFVPSAFKPLVESATNTSWTGLPIYKDTPFNKDMPAWTKSYPRTNSQLVDLSKWANEASGGNDYKAGWANFNPAQLEYLLNGYFGGYSNVINKMIKTGETMLRKREYDPSSILLVNRLVKMGDERTAEKKINSDFFHYLEEYKRTHALLRKYEDEADRGTDKYRILLNALRHSIDGVRHDVMEEYMADYNWLNKAIKDPDTTDKERAMYEDEMRALKREIVSLMKTAHDSVQINRLKNFSPHNTYSNNNMNVNHIDNI